MCVFSESNEATKIDSSTNLWAENITLPTKVKRVQPPFWRCCHRNYIKRDTQNTSIENSPAASGYQNPTTRLGHPTRISCCLVELSTSFDICLSTQSRPLCWPLYLNNVTNLQIGHFEKDPYLTSVAKLRLFEARVIISCWIWRASFVISLIILSIILFTCSWILSLLLIYSDWLIINLLSYELLLPKSMKDIFRLIPPANGTDCCKHDLIRLISCVTDKFFIQQFRLYTVYMKHSHTST